MYPAQRQTYFEGLVVLKTVLLTSAGVLNILLKYDSPLYGRLYMTCTYSRCSSVSLLLELSRTNQYRVAGTSDQVVLLSTLTN